MKTWSEALKHVSVSSAGEGLKQKEIFLPLWFAAVSLFNCGERGKKENVHFLLVSHIQQITAGLFFLSLLFFSFFLTLD